MIRYSCLRVAGSGRRRSHLPPSSHTTVRTVPYTAVHEAQRAPERQSPQRRSPLPIPARHLGNRDTRVAVTLDPPKPSSRQFRRLPSGWVSSFSALLSASLAVSEI